MLTRELMGALALAILWINTLLVVGAAFGPLRELLDRLAGMKTSLRKGEVVRGDDDHVFARHRIEQVGRRASDDRDRRAIVFHDRRRESTVAGGLVRFDDQEEVEIEAVGEGGCDVWTSAADGARAAACPSGDAFSAAYDQASKAKGFERTVDLTVREGAAVWIATAAGRVLVATIDPGRVCRRKIALLTLFMFAMIGLCALCTFLALYPPVFGLVSIAGGALGLAFFLLVQPAGVMARDAALVPSRTELRGSWVDPGSEGKGGPREGEAIYAD